MKPEPVVLAQLRSDLLDDWYPRQNRLDLFAEAIEHPLPVFDVLFWESSDDWLNDIHSLLIHDRPVPEIMKIAEERGDQSVSCVLTNIGHPSATVTIGMIFAAAALFVAVAYAASRH